MRACRYVLGPSVGCRSSAFEVDLCEHVAEERDLAGSIRQDVRERRATVEPFLDRTHLSGADHPEQPGIDEDVDVVGDGTARSVESLGELGHRHRTLEDEVDDRAAQWVAERLQLRRCVDVQLRCQVVVAPFALGGRRVVNVRHFPNSREIWDERQPRHSAVG